jgi:hypothetical protein
MTHFFDIENKAWDSVKDGTIRAFETDTEIPVTVFLQWFEGGWNRIYEVRVGLNNSGRIIELSKRDNDVAKNTLKRKSPYFSDIPVAFLERVPTLVAGLQRDIEGTRQAVQLLRDEVKRLTSSGSLNKFWQDAEDNERAIVAYKLKELLYQSGVHAYRVVAFELLSFKNNKGELMSLSAFNRLSRKGERLVQQRNTTKGSKK